MVAQLEVVLLASLAASMGTNNFIEGKIWFVNRPRSVPLGMVCFRKLYVALAGVFSVTAGKLRLVKFHDSRDLLERLSFGNHCIAFACGCVFVEGKFSTSRLGDPGVSGGLGIMTVLAWRPVAVCCP